MCLANGGSERLDEVADPQDVIDRIVEICGQKGCIEEWTTQRTMIVKMKKEPTDEWGRRGITQEKDYAILTN